MIPSPFFSAVLKQQELNELQKRGDGRWINYAFAKQVME